VVSTLGWTLGLVLVSPNVILDPLIQFLSTLGAWYVFWMNLVKQPIVLAIFGAAQFPILRRFVRKAHWWILVSALGGALKGATSSTVAYILHPELLPAPFPTALSYGSGWLGYGIVTGICLQWLLRHQPR
jgi:Na+/H+-dicarboxylate symporter